MSSESTDMSTTATSSSEQSTGSSNNNNNQNNGNSTSSSLYLFTFLATLLLLLAVSCAIVARSLVVRRRFRRRVEEAIAAGLIPPTNAPPGFGGVGGLGGMGGRRRDIGQKPTMWDSWLAPTSGDVGWGDIKPVSVKVLSETLTGAGLPRDPPKNSNGRTLNAPSNDYIARPRHRLLSAIPFPLTYRQSPSPAPTPNPSNNDSPNAEAEKSADTSPASLQVAVLIAMPSPYRPQSWSAYDNSNGASELTRTKGKERSSNSMYLDGEEDLPDVVFGVAEVPWDVHASTLSSSEDVALTVHNEKTS
ncbi:hypothetical protein SCHPADRAFT_900624 [Schizopora paradoxa]|uniref:Uncharacterized protein n=1 Tax=Schizopora paradoxa TaxID=27342 RepID=A0A0H2S7B3_9AGAM|nr:hypothetical protein SCHPADRAFT_900624 [Schizopora paradoxa]